MPLCLPSISLNAMTDLLSFLNTRRSAALKNLAEPGPDRAQLEAILTAGSRVPDHGKYTPWHFIVFEGEARATFGAVLAQAYAQQDPAAAPAKLELEAERFLRAPTVVAVISRIRPGKHAAWEQILSAGAICYNLCLAANALGFGSNWLTEWPTYDDHVRQVLGLGEHDNIAGFLYFGTATEKQEDRERPDLARITTYWQDERTPINRGDGYGFGTDMPKKGFTL